MRYIVTIIVGLVLLCSQAFAFPRFAAQYEQKCALCHVNPTGCGMRNIYGAQNFAQTELPAHKSATSVKPSFSDVFSIGMDARTLYIYNDNNKQSSFFQMEGNLYLNAQLTNRFNLTLAKGINSEYEVYGVANYLPYQGILKVGKFQPSYGWRFQDHSSFVREAMLWPPTYFDTGIEIGIYPSSISANIGLFNGSSDQVNPFDNDKGKAFSARLEYRKHIAFLGLGLGGSYWRNDTGINTVDEYGPFYYINLLGGRLIHLGEVDWLKQKSGITAMATTQSLSFRIQQGLYIEGDYDYLDPNIDLKSGAVNRYSFHLDYFPIGFMELEPIIRYYDDGLISDKYWNLMLQGHFFF